MIDKESGHFVCNDLLASHRRISLVLALNAVRSFARLCGANAGNKCTEDVTFR